MGEQAAEAAPEAKASVEKKRTLLQRIPTPLIVTLVGIALTAWLLPAFTRQWDDRQKAQEIRAAIASQIADATAHALVKSHTVERALPRTPDGMPDHLKAYGIKAESRLADMWLAYRIAIETRLRAYFNSDAVFDALDHYNRSMFYVFGTATGAQASAHALERAFGMSKHSARAIEGLTNDGFLSDALSDLDYEMLNEENRFISQMSHAHVSGYSTTSHDLIHDLIP